MSRTLIAHIPTVVIAITQIRSRNANVCALTFCKARLARTLGFEEGGKKQKCFRVILNTVMLYLNERCITLLNELHVTPLLKSHCSCYMGAGKPLLLLTEVLSKTWSENPRAHTWRWGNENWHVFTLWCLHLQPAGMVWSNTID